MDRIFAVGPAPCPYRGCGKILRKNKFKSQLFEDLGVEREVDVRARVNKTFNKSEADFASLEEYNNYLEEVETTVFNLVNGVDVEATMEKLQAYEKQNRAKILENSLRQQNEEAAQEQWAVVERQRKEKERALRRQFELEEKQARADSQQEILRQLSTSTSADADQITKQVHKATANRLYIRQKQVEAEIDALRAQGRAAAPLAKFRQRLAASEEAPLTPFSPFNGDRQLQYPFHEGPSYFDPAVDDATSRPDCLASGFSIPRARRQALIQAFLGLSCDVAAEKMKNTNSTSKVVS